MIKNAKYTSRRITHEFLQVMSDQIESVQLKALLSSPYYSIMVDETTDISIVKEMVLYACFMSCTDGYIAPSFMSCTDGYIAPCFMSCTDGYIAPSFMKLVALSDGRAETVEEAILA